ncbi:MAG TPA: dephospho-CoA kinase [Terriglobales bacterium]|nr:dephospho-CoA kinase [Terriglobales bacterium]
MLRVGLTGGVACGKTTVGEMFVRRGAHLVQADRIAHDLMQPGTGVYARIVETFGRGILNADGSVSRPRLAEAAFGKGRIAELNAIVHPAVIAEEDRWMNRVEQADRGAIAIVEAALLVEASRAKSYDKLITVTCSFDQKAARFAARHGMDLDAARAEVKRRMAAQASDEEKIRVSDYVIDNSGSLAETEKQVEVVFRELAGNRRIASG